MSPPRFRRGHSFLWSLLIAPALLLIGALLAGTTADRTLFEAINAQGPRFALSASLLSVAGLGAVAVIVAAGIGLRWPAVPAAVLMVVLLGGAAVQGCKLLLSMPRPLGALGPDAIQQVGIALKARSMPSGHAAMISALAAMAWAAPATRWRRFAHRPLAWLLSIAATLGALARVAVGAHWPSDVLVGIGMGIMAGTLVAGSSAGRRAVAALGAGLTGRRGARLMSFVLAATALSLWHTRDDYPLATALSIGLSGAGVLIATGWWLRWR